MRGSRWGGLLLHGCVALTVLVCLASAPMAQAAPSAYDQLAAASPASSSPSGQTPADDRPDVPLGTVAIGPNLTITGSELDYRGSRVRLGGGLRLRCPGGGDIRASLGDNLRFSGLFRWSLRVNGVVGPSGCELADGFELGSGTTAQITLRAADGRLSVGMEVAGTVKTTFVPTQSAFTTSISVLVGRSDYAVKASGKAPGASFSAAFASDGTFALDFSLSDLKLGNVDLNASGRAVRSSAGGPIEVTFRTRVSQGTQIAPGLSLLEVELGLSRDELQVSATIRLRCQTGSINVTATGLVRKTRDYALSASAQSSACGFGTGVVVDGGVFGKIASSGGRVTYDFGAHLSQLDFGWMALNRTDRLGAVMQRAGVRLTNTCDGCDATMRITAGTGIALTVDARTFGPPLTLGARIDLQVDLAVPAYTAEFISLSLTGLSANGFKLPTSLVLQSALERRISEVFSTPWGRSSGSRVPCQNPNCTNPVATGAPGVEGAADATAGRGTSTARPRIVGLTVGVMAARAEVRVRLSAARAVVRMDVQRRRCLAGTCTWALEAYARAKADKAGVSRYRSPRRLADGNYRIVARTGGPRSRAVIRTFRVS